MFIQPPAGDRRLEITGYPDDYYEIISGMFAVWCQNENIKNKKDIHKITITGNDCEYLIETPDETIIAPSESSFLSLLEQIITNALRESMSNYLQLHAATLDYNGKGFTISGPHGSGKTTLTLTGLSCGCKALSDEITVIDNKNHAIGFPRPFRVRQGTLSLEPSIIPEGLSSFSTEDGISHFLFSLERFGLYKAETNIGYIFFPERKPGPSVLRHLTQRETIERLLPQGFNIYRSPETFIPNIIELARTTANYEISYSDNWDAIRTIQKIISVS